MIYNRSYDYLIIGQGLAGFQLALAMSEDPYFDDKQIAIIDKSSKNRNDKTWCFWEDHKGQWEELIFQSWEQAKFHSSKRSTNLVFSPYRYKMIRAIDFYNQAKLRLGKKRNFQLILDEVILTEDINSKAHVGALNQNYTANHAFDSRIPASFKEEDDSIKLIQHFKGWIIKTDSPLFDPESFTMMDYRIKDGEQCTFTYVLPLSKDRALIEYTYFTASIVEEQIYDTNLERYISDILQIEQYQIEAEESGQIPMTTFPFEKYNSKHITKIGTAGGWVKGSSGYSFKHTEKKVKQIIQNIKSGHNPSEGLYSKKFKFYDKVFLKVLQDNNEKGEWIFEQFFRKNKTPALLKFLDEESTRFEDLKIISSLFSFAFIKAFFRTL